MDLFSCFKKSKTTPSQNEKEYLCVQYRTTIDHLHQFMEFKKATPSERIAFLEFAIKVIGKDIESYYLSHFIYEKEEEPSKFFKLFPISFFMESTSKIQGLLIAGKAVVTVPYDLSKISSAALDIKEEGFCQNKNYTNGFFVPEFDMVFVTNGRHHIAAATAFGGGSVDVDVYSLKEIFSQLRVSDDGENWILGEKSLPVYDARFAVLYELARELNQGI